jgi:hypothetical protein
MYATSAMAGSRNVNGRAALIEKLYLRGAKSSMFFTRPRLISRGLMTRSTTTFLTQNIAADAEIY